MRIKTVKELAKDYFKEIAGCGVDEVVLMEIYKRAVQDVQVMTLFKRLPPDGKHHPNLWEGYSESIDWTGVPAGVPLLVEKTDGSFTIRTMRVRPVSGNVLVEKIDDRQIEIFLGVVKSWRVLTTPMAFMLP